MKTFTEQRKLGLIVVITLTISMLFVGIGTRPLADQSESLELNQTNTLSLGVGAYAQLNLNGEALSGEILITEIGGFDVSADFIEIFSIRLDLTVPDSRTGRCPVSGRTNAGPLIFTKRLDQTTPLLVQGFFNNFNIEGDFLLFQTNAEDGTTEHRFTYRVTDGRILSIRTFTVQLVGGGSMIVEEISIGYLTLAWIDEVFSVEYEYNYRDVGA